MFGQRLIHCFIRFIAGQDDLFCMGTIVLEIAGSIYVRLGFEIIV